MGSSISKEEDRLSNDSSHDNLNDAKSIKDTDHKSYQRTDSSNDTNHGNIQNIDLSNDTNYDKLFEAKTTNDRKYNYSAIDLNISKQEKLYLKTDFKKRKCVINEFINKYDLHYDERKKYIEQKTKQLQKNQEIRSNIRILIIVVSIPDCYTIRTLEDAGDFFENAEDFTTAFLLCHLFHYAFLIPYSQILITSTEENSFINTKTLQQFNYKNFNIDDDFYFEFKVEEFGFHQNINYAQIGKIQYKFSLEKSMIERIKPFHHKIINKELFSDKKSEIFLFLLDHGLSNFFEYRFFIDELMKVPCDVFYVMNDSCCSGSLIEMIKISNQFEDIFTGQIDSDSEFFFVKFLFTFGLVDENKLKETLINNISVIDSFSFDSSLKKVIKNIILNMNENTTHRVFEFIQNVSNKFPGISTFIPVNFANFGRKSIIFSSSDYQNVSFTLPARKISALLTTNYRICGSVFSSVFIESLLTRNDSFEDFCASIKEKFLQYRDDFQQIIINQNQDILGSNSLRKILSKETIQSFFKSDLSDDFHCYNKLNKWHNLNSILVKDQFYWNVDVSTVNKTEYEKVYVCKLGKNSVCLNPNDFGPIEGESFVGKFAFDFEVAFNKELKDKNINNIKFTTNQPTDPSEKEIYQEKEFMKWAKFMTSIRPYITSKIGNGILALKYPVLKFFYDNPNFNDKEGLEMFLKAFESIVPFWKDYSLFC